MTQEEVIKIVKENNPQKFQKSGQFTFYRATKEEEIVTEINGEVETKNTAKVGDYILTGSVDEQYVLKPDTFNKRYEVVELENDVLFGVAKATGTCFGNIYKGEPISFTASWGELMTCHPEDYLVSPDAEFSQAYRIEKSAFEKTYKPA